MSPTAPVREEERRQEDLDAEDVPDPAEEETQDVPQDPVDAPEEAPEVEKKKRKEKKMFLHKEERRNHKMIHLPVPEKFPSRLEEAPREEMSSYASSEELSVHNESLDKKRAIDQPPVPEKYMSRPEEIQRRMKKIPRRIQAPKCARGVARSRSSRTQDVQISKEE